MVAFSAILPNFSGHVVASSHFRLRLLHAVGRGAYGVVYLARDLSTSLDNPKYYAVKCMLKHEPGSDLEFVQEREMTYHKHMSYHPNISTVHEVIADEHYVYIVMDFYEGGDLFGAIAERQSFARRDESVKNAIVQLLDAVEACHEAGIFHRDLKPENIMCSHEDSRIYLSDFGLATQTASSTSFGCGSAYYMSPECIGESSGQIRSHPYATASSDVWSIGIIMANILTGRNPWHIASPLRDESYAQYLKDGARYLPCILPVSKEAAHVLARTLDPNPCTRIAIPELRRAILDVGTFFPPEDVPDYIRIADESFEASLKGLPPRESNTASFIDVAFEVRCNLSSSLVAVISVTHVEAVSSSFVNQDSDESDTESDGPITPEIHPIEPISIVPHLALAEKNGAVDIMELQVPEPAKVHTKLPKPVRRFMGAIHRVF